jgi:tRNA threonylcarbamoyladenosine biosynthesis protein TsaB
VADEFIVLAEAVTGGPDMHSERLMPSILSALSLSRTPPGELGLIAYVLGPGSFTGLRIGISTAKGLAYGLGIPICGVSSLEAIAHNAPGCGLLICPMLDARKGEVYCSSYSGLKNGALKQLRPERVSPAREFAGSIRREALFIGDGAIRYRDDISAALRGKARFAPEHLGHPLGAVIARIALEQFRKHGGDRLESAAPVYIRKSEAEIKLLEGRLGVPGARGR